MNKGLNDYVNKLLNEYTFCDNCRFFVPKKKVIEIQDESLCKACQGKYKITDTASRKGSIVIQSKKNKMVGGVICDVNPFTMMNVIMYKTTNLHLIHLCKKFNLPHPCLQKLVL